MSSFAERLSDLMFEKNVTTKQLATSIGVNPTSVNDWKRGKYQICLSNLVKVADYLGCSLDFLMGRSDNIIDYTPQPCPPFYSHLLAVLEKCGKTRYSIHANGIVKDAYIYKWSKGADPLAVTLVLLADFLDVTLDYLVGRDSGK